MRSQDSKWRYLPALNFVFLLLLLVLDNVKAKAVLECINTEAEFNQYKLTTEGSVEFDPSSLLLLRGGDSGVTRVSKAYEEFGITDDTTATYVYIKYSAAVSDDGEWPILTVRPNEDENLEIVDINSNDEDEQILELYTGLIAAGDNLYIGIEKFKAGESLKIDKIALYYGIKYADPNVRPPLDEIQATIIAGCDWIPPTTTTGPSTEYQDPPLQKLQCIDGKPEFDQHGWKAPITGGYGNTAADLPVEDLEEARGIFYVPGDNVGNSKYYTLIQDKLSEESVFLYLRHSNVITSTAGQKVTVSTQVSDPTEVGLGDENTWTEDLVTLDSADLLVAELELTISGFRDTEYFFFDKIALFTGFNGSRTDDDIIEEIATACGWNNNGTWGTTPDDTRTTPDDLETPSTSNATDWTGSTDGGGDGSTTPEIEVTTPKPLQFEVILTDQDFKDAGWASNPPHKFVTSADQLPAAAKELKIEGEGVFYFEGNDTLPFDKTMQKTLTYDDLTLSTYLYIKYYALVTKDPRPIIVSPTNDPGSQTQLEGTDGFKWKEFFVQVKTTTRASDPIRINVQNLAAKEYFFLEKIYLVHGDREFDNIEDLKDAVDEHLGGLPTGGTEGSTSGTEPPEKDDGGFGTAELVLVIVLPIVGVAAVCGGLYFFLRRRRNY